MTYCLCALLFVLISLCVCVCVALVYELISLSQLQLHCRASSPKQICAPTFNAWALLCKDCIAHISKAFLWQPTLPLVLCSCSVLYFPFFYCV